MARSLCFHLSHNPYIHQEITAFAAPPSDVLPLTEREQGLRDLMIMRVRDMLSKYSRAEVHPLRIVSLFTH